MYGYALVVISNVFGASVAYDRDITLTVCRAGQAVLATKGVKDATCCFDAPDNVTDRHNTPHCPNGVLPFPYVEGDEAIFGTMAWRQLTRRAEGWR